MTAPIKRFHLPRPARTAMAAVTVALLAASLTIGLFVDSGAAQGATERMVSHIDGDGLIDGTFVGSRDRLRVGYAVRADEERYIVLDGKAGPRYARIGTPHFSPDSKRVAYAAKRADGKLTLVVDGVELGPYDEFAPTSDVFSPDSRRVAYGVRTGGDWHLVADGQPGPAYDELALHTFSPDGLRLAYVARRSNEWFVVTDGIEGPPVARLPSESLRFSPDGSTLAYAAQIGERWTVVVNGQPGPGNDLMGRGSPSFSADGRIAYRAQRGGQWYAIIGGQEYGPYARAGTIAFSSNGARWAYPALIGDRWSLITDGVQGPAYDGIEDESVVFSADGRRVAYVAKQGPLLFAVVDGEAQLAFERVEALQFSPNGQRWAYAGLLNSEWSLVVDGRVAAKAAEVLDNSFAFSPGGRHWAAAIRDGDSDYVLVDGKRSRRYGAISNTGGPAIVFDGEGKVRYLAAIGRRIVAVEQKIR